MKLFSGGPQKDTEKILKSYHKLLQRFAKAHKDSKKYPKREILAKKEKRIRQLLGSCFSASTLQDFDASLHKENSHNGIFVTTSEFTSEVHKMSFGEKKIILINGDKLADYMIEFNVGVSTIETREIKELSDNFLDWDGKP